jgi:hypothetical protein
MLGTAENPVDAEEEIQSRAGQREQDAGGDPAERRLGSAFMQQRMADGEQGDVDVQYQ